MKTRPEEGTAALHMEAGLGEELEVAFQLGVLVVNALGNNLDSLAGELNSSLGGTDLGDSARELVDKLDVFPLETGWGESFCGLPEEEKTHVAINLMRIGRRHELFRQKHEGFHAEVGLNETYGLLQVETATVALRSGIARGKGSKELDDATQGALDALQEIIKDEVQEIVERYVPDAVREDESYQEWKDRTGSTDADDAVEEVRGMFESWWK